LASTAYLPSGNLERYSFKPDFAFVKSKIEEKLVDYVGKYQIILLPNITNIVYGRDVGYKIEKIDLDHEIESISATEIRKEMGL